MIKINPRENGIHSLAEALRAFKKFQEDPNDVFALKDSILRSHHALETLFKDVLYSHNPILLVDETIRIEKFLEGYEKKEKGENATELDELKTANLDKVIERLSRFGLLRGQGQEEYKLFLDSVRKLSFYRNRLQHFELSEDPYILGRTLGVAIPRAIEILERVPFHHPLLGVINYPPIMEDLKKLFPEAPDIIDTLRRDYDALIQDAIKFFKGRTFNDQSLKLRIQDHGMVGPPPYLPELLSEGFLGFKYDIHDLLQLGGIQNIGQTGRVQSYLGRIQVGQPTFTKHGVIQDLGSATGKLDFDAQITFDRADPFLLLPSAGDKVTLLRGMTVNIGIFLEYTAEAFMNEYHYDCRKILEAKGLLDVRVAAVPKGYGSEDVEIVGEYHCDLNQENAPFRLHSFVEPDGSLRERSPRVFEWTINTTGNVKFEGT